MKIYYLAIAVTILMGMSNLLTGNPFVALVELSLALILLVLLPAVLNVRGRS